MSKNINFFPEKNNFDEIKFEYPQSIDFKDKTFHLSGLIVGGRKKLGEDITQLGGKFEIEYLSKQETDYLVCADKGVRVNGVLKPYGNKAINVQRYNDKNTSRHIPIIKESHCKKLISEYLVRNSPKNKMK